MEPPCALALCCLGLLEIVFFQVYSHEWVIGTFPGHLQTSICLLQGRILTPLSHAAPSAVSQVDMDTPLHELFGAMPWSSWDDANLSWAGSGIPPWVPKAGNSTGVQTVSAPGSGSQPLRLDDSLKPVV